MKTIKIIDLLNKIANGEEVPQTIKYDDFYWNWCGSCKIYEARDEENIEINLYRSLVYEGDLNDEVEILDKEDEFEDIYSLCDNSEQYNFSSRQTGMTKEDRRLLDSNFKELLIVVNQLIKNQKKIIERLKDE